MTEEAVEQVRAFLIGEVEPIRRYGVTFKYPRWKQFIPGWRRRVQRLILAEHADDGNLT